MNQIGCCWGLIIGVHKEIEVRVASLRNDQANSMSDDFRIELKSKSKRKKTIASKSFLLY